MQNQLSFFKISLCSLVLLLSVLSPGFAQDYGGEENIRINSNVVGTLLTPEKPTNTLAIIIPGSGPTDRNGNQQMTRNNSLKLLAEELKSQGIATYRYDKRVLTLLKRNALNEEDLTFDMFIEDAVATVSYFKEENRFTEIFLIGHSQGSLVGMVAAQQSPVSGFVSLAGAGQSVDQTIINQITLQMPDLKGKAVEAFATLKKEGKVTDYSPALTSIFRASVQPFMASWIQYDPQIEIGKLSSENVLIVSGTNDVQISTEEAQLLQNGNPDATLVLIENMNHVLRIIEGDNLENTKSYNQPELPISEEMIRAITSFIMK